MKTYYDQLIDQMIERLSKNQSAKEMADMTTALCLGLAACVSFVPSNDSRNTLLQGCFRFISEQTDNMVDAAHKAPDTPGQVFRPFEPEKFDA